MDTNFVCRSINSTPACWCIGKVNPPRLAVRLNFIPSAYQAEAIEVSKHKRYLNAAVLRLIWVPDTKVFSVLKCPKHVGYLS